MGISLFIGLCAAVLAQPAAEDIAKMRRGEAHQRHQMQMMETQGWLQQLQQAIARLEQDVEEAPDPVRNLLRQKLQLHKKQEAAMQDKLKAHEKEDSEKAWKAMTRLEELELQVTGVNLHLEEAEAVNAVLQLAETAGAQEKGAEMAEDVKATYLRQREIRNAIAELRREEASLVRKRDMVFEKLDKMIEKKAK